MSTRRVTRINRGEGLTGLTLLELILALATLGLITAAIAAMFSAIGHATRQRDELRRLTVQKQAVSARLEQVIRGARATLEVNDDSLTLWTKDVDKDGEVDDTERLRIERTDDAELMSYTPGDRGLLGLSLLGGSSDSERRLWARGVADWTPRISTNDERDARLVTYHLTLEAGALRDETTAAVALRSARP